MLEIEPSDVKKLTKSIDNRLLTVIEKEDHINCQKHFYFKLFSLVKQFSLA